MYEDYSLECWTYGFLIRDLFYDSSYNDSYVGLHSPIVTNIEYPNKHIREEIAEEDKLFIKEMCKKLMKKSVLEYQEEMSNMRAYKDNFLPLFKDEKGVTVAQRVTIDEIARDLKQM